MEPTSYYPFFNHNATQGNSSQFIDLYCGEKIETTLRELYSIEYTLKKPLPITLEYEDMTYIIIQNTINIGVESKSLRTGEKELAFEIIKLYKRLDSLYKDNPNTLGPYPLEMLMYLKEYISKSE